MAPSNPIGDGKGADLELVGRIRSGDGQAFEALYRQHATRLYNLASRMIGVHGEADDLLQDIFLSAHRKLESFRGESALGTWLYRLATNQCLDFLRSRATKTGQLTDALDDEPHLFDSASRSIAEQTVARMDLERAVAQLPEGCRAAFLLHDVQGLEHGEVAMRPLVLREIAQALGLHESTISRVTTQKFMATPRGTFELKYFFGSHVATDTGGAASSTAIRALIKQLVAAEDARAPLSDARIAQILGEQGIVVARRTIAKYRESLQIAPVNQRKNL